LLLVRILILRLVGLRLSDLCGLHRRFRVLRRFQLQLRLRFGLGCWQLAQQLGKLNVA